MDLKSRLVSAAAGLGFKRARVASVGAGLDMQHYDAYIAAGYHGNMEWMARGRDERAFVERLLPGARSVLVMAFDYAQAVPPDPGGLTGRVASYAWGRDYHNFVLKRVRKLQAILRHEGWGVDSYSSVDTRPVFERAWAARAGVGYPAKNTCQVLPGEGSEFFLATLLLTAELEPDPPLDDHCGRCQRCIDACPTAAILPGGGLDARRCISYLTIEHPGAVDLALRPLMGRWLFGCDDCQTVCPHGRRGAGPDETAPRHAWVHLPTVLAQTQEEHFAYFGGCPVRRASGERLARNAALVMGNLGDRAALPSLEQATRLGGVVGEAAGWAIDRIHGRV